MSNKEKLTKTSLNLNEYEKDLLWEIQELKDRIRELEKEIYTLKTS